MKTIGFLYAGVSVVCMVGMLFFMWKVSDPDETWGLLNFILAVALGILWPALPVILAGVWVLQKIIKYAPWAMGHMFEEEETDDDE